MPKIQMNIHAIALGASLAFSVISSAQAEETIENNNQQVTSEQAKEFLKTKRPVLLKFNYNISTDYVDGILEPDITQFFQLDPKRKNDKRLNLSSAGHLIAPLSERSLLHIAGIVDWFGYEEFDEYNSVTIGNETALYYKFNSDTVLKVSGFYSSDYFTNKKFEVPTHMSSSYGGQLSLNKNYQLSEGALLISVGGTISRRTFEFATLSDQDRYQGDIAFTYQPLALRQLSLFSRLRFGKVDAFNNPFLDNDFYGFEVGFNWILKPGLTVSLTGSYSDGNYNAPELTSLALALEEIKGTGLSGEISYDLNERLNIYGRASLTDFDSNLPRNDFRQTIISIGARSPF
ncbi:MAG: hypothetical protein ABJN57_03755 [Hyphomicrobiales bacterium]